MFPQNLTDNFNSALPEITWPPVPNDQAASLLAMLAYLDQSQHWPYERIMEAQFSQAQILLRHARQTTDYYRDILTEELCTAPLDMARWLEIPLLHRSGIQRRGAALHSRQVPKHHGEIFTTQTSGSTGENVVVTGTDLTRHFWNVLTLREHLWHTRSVDGVHAIIRVLGDAARGGVTNADWGIPFNLVWRTGASAMCDLVTDIQVQADWLRRVTPRYLLTYPSNLAALLELFEAAGETLPGLSQVRTIGETLAPEIRDNCRRIWGVPVVDLYSSQEVGYIALQCPESDCYHVQAESLIVEILDDDGRPCRPGDIGRVVLTALHNFAMPLIRYDIGDYAEVAEPCCCGRSLPTLKKIMGRRRNLLTLPTGERFWPIFGHMKFRDVAPVRQYQVIQTALDRLEVRLVVETPLSPAQEAGLREIIRAAVRYPLAIDFVYHDSLVIIAGKHEEFRSEL